MSASNKNIYGAVPAVERGRNLNLGADPKGENLVYTCGNSVFVRNLENPLQCWMFSDHAHTVTAAKYAPSGFYIASADERGTLKVWDTTQEEHLTKFELPVIAGPIRDIAWTEDSKRICAVGESRGGSYGRVFMWDSGSSVGEITGPSDNLLSCDIKPNRPYRMAVAGEDNCMCWFEGPPFKFKKSADAHTRFCTAARFSPDGTKLATVSLDKKGMMYDGKTGEKLGEFGTDDAHTGGVYALSWAPDSTKFMTASADRTVKVWDAESRTVTATFKVDTAEQDLQNQQVGCAWVGDKLISVGLSGHIHYWDLADTSKPAKVVYGHNKFVTALTRGDDGAVYTVSFDQVFVRWDPATGESQLFKGIGHSNQVHAMHFQAGSLVSAGLDDTVRITPVEGLDLNKGKSFGLGAPVLDCAVHGDDTVAAVTSACVALIKGGELKQRLDIGFGGHSVTFTADGSKLLVGGDDHAIHVFDVAGDALTESSKLEKHRGPVSSLTTSPDGKWIASADSAKRLIVLWDAATLAPVFAKWEFHGGRVNNITFSPDSTHLISGSLDQDMYVWNVVDKRMRKVLIKGAHRGGVNDCIWLDDTTVASCGQDCTWKTWTITHN